MPLNLIQEVDDKTGLLGRKSFSAMFRHQNSFMSRKMSYNTTVGMIDIDNFKSINDTYGHLKADKILKEFAHVVKDSLRSYDEVFRFGGDEFIVLLPKTDDECAWSIVDRLRNKIEKTMFDRDVKITVSVGHFTGQNSNLGEDIYLSNADRAMYEAKKTGKNQVYSYHYLRT